MMIDPNAAPQTAPNDAEAPSAVDDLAKVRAQIAALKCREAELCDEIRACATEQGDTRVRGTTADAVIETRRPRRIDMSKLPIEIISNPEMYRNDRLIHVLIWPKARTQTAQLETERSDAPQNDASGDLRDNTLAETDGNEAAVIATSPNEPPLTDAPITTPETPIEQDASIDKANDATLGEDSFKFRREAEITNIFAQGPSRNTADLSNADQPEKVNNAQDTSTAPHHETDNTAPFLLTKAILRLTAQTSPAQGNAGAEPYAKPDAHPSSHEADALRNTIADILERPAPRDLKPTQIATLQPLAGLHDEHIAAVLADADAPLDTPPMTKDIEEAQALEAKVDAIAACVDAGEDIADLRAPSTPKPFGFEQVESEDAVEAAFASRRAANHDD
ncbi:hypothetical protein [Celeribacter sp.]|uniref:hypothetical protein n=1 Tax=Celeribacter sp. TaxID=1890673 RepID=UPI003A8D2441